VFGQDAAISTVVRAVKRSRAGLAAPDRPVGCVLFMGPTGVGKTELARQLATTLGLPFLRFDMSEYMEKHAVARLIGAPPGYVGYDEGGQLVESIRKSPHAVLLLDEIEKAHRDIFDILLQVMDRATLTDNHGREADFRHVALIMTSNVGAREMEKPAIGFAGQRKSGKSAFERMFSPEFRNRLDEVVQFNPLSPEVMGRVVDKFLEEVREQLREKKVSLRVSDEARAWLAEKGYRPPLWRAPLGPHHPARAQGPALRRAALRPPRKGRAAQVDLAPTRHRSATHPPTLPAVVPKSPLPALTEASPGETKKSPLPSLKNP